MHFNIFIKLLSRKNMQMHVFYVFCKNSLRGTGDRITDYLNEGRMLYKEAQSRMNVLQMQSI